VIVFFLISLLFLLLRAGSELSLIVIAYAVLKYVKFKVPSGPAFSERLKRAFKAF